jgi:hypothetical protein
MAHEWYRKASVQTAIITSFAAMLVTLLVHYSPKEKLEKTILELEAENRKLENSLAPFVTLAAERFGGPIDLALNKLSARFNELDEKLEHEKGLIRYLEVEVFVTLSGIWSSPTLPDFSKLFRTGARSNDIKVHLLAQGGDFKELNFENSTPPRFTQGQENTRILDYRAEAIAGCWIIGAHKSVLSECKNLEVQIYGVDHTSTTDSVLTIQKVLLVFYVNGLPTHQCEFSSPLSDSLTSDHGKGGIKVKMNGPAAIKPFP